MGDVTIRNVSGRGELEINIAGVRPRWFCAEGELVDVPDQVDGVVVAGRAPSGEPGDDDYDPGEGLLAQPSNWELVPPAEARKARAVSAAGGPNRDEAPAPTPDTVNADDTVADASSDAALPQSVEV